jgi:hypothetical protein
MLDLSQVGKPKAGRPGPRRRASDGAEGAESDMAAILMQMAAVSDDLPRRSAPLPVRSGSARRQPRAPGSLPTWQRARSRLLDHDGDHVMAAEEEEEEEEGDVQISDVDEAPPTPKKSTRRRVCRLCPALSCLLVCILRTAWP